MDHFISVIFAKQLNESKRDIVLDTMINTARVGLTEDSVEYELYESENNSTVLRLPLAKPIKEAHQQAFVEALANRLFDKGHTDFEIELSVLNENLLRQGSRGADVKALQAQLGMPAAEQDGIFGPKTEQAVRNFQTSMGLQVDGIVGPQTRAAIANSEAAGAATRDAPYNPQPVPQTPTQRRAQQQAPQTAAPQTSPRPQARPAPQTSTQQTTQGPAGGPAPAPSQGVTGSARGMDVDMSGPMDAVRQMAQDQQARFDADDDQPATGPGATPEPLKNTELPTGPGGDQPLPTAQDQRRGQNQDAINPDANDPRAGNTDSGFRAPAPASGADDSAAAQNLAGPAQRGMAQAATPPPDPDANDPRLGNTDSGARGNPNLPEPEVMTTAPAQPTAPAAQGSAAVTVPGDDRSVRGRDITRQTTPPTLGGPAGAETLPQTQDNAANRDAQVVAQQQAEFRARYNDDTSGRDGLPNEFVTQALDPALDNLSSETAQTLADAAADAPAAVARIIKRDIERTYGNEEELMNMAREIEAEDVDQSRALETLSKLYNSLNMTDARDKIADQSANFFNDNQQDTFFNDSVEPRPKGAFMFRERNEWDELYSRTHNKDGSLKAKTSLIESRKYDEVTYHDDDQFYEDYGVMWYNDDEVVDEAKYRGRKVKLGKPMKGDVKKFKVYVKNPKGNVVKVNFGQKGVKIKKSNPARRRSFRARHNCDNPGPRHKARYWSCRKW